MSEILNESQDLDLSVSDKSTEQEQSPRLHRLARKVVGYILTSRKSKFFTRVDGYEAPLMLIEDDDVNPKFDAAIEAEFSAYEERILKASAKSESKK